MEKLDKALKGLQICMPETEEDSKLECDGCPYDSRDGCSNFVSLPLSLIEDIREVLKGVKDGRKN